MKSGLRKLVTVIGFSLLCQFAWAQVTVTIDQAAGQTDPTNVDPVKFKVTFQFPVNGFDETDINSGTSTAPGTLVATVTEIAPMNSTVYEVSITGMTGDGNVIITIAGGAASRISNGDLSDPSTNTDNAIKYDTTIPALDALTPTDGATGVAQNANLILDFNEPINAGTGTINLRRYSDDAIFDFFTMPAGASVASDKATLNPSGNLVSGIRYYVEVPAGAFTDKAGNPFAGFSTKDDWDFTVSIIAPNISGFNNNPACVGETLIITGSNFGLSIPTVTINSVAASVSAHTTSSITVTVPSTTTGTVQVTNNDISQSDSDGGLVINPGVNTGLAVTEATNSIITGGNVNVTLSSSQSGVSYRLRKISPGAPGTVDGPKAGTGADLLFNTGTLSTAGTYQFQIRAQAGTCNSVDLPDIVTITVVDFTANAGADASICNGDGVTLGGSPTASGGSGFYMVSWTSSPAGFTSNSSNPVVTPSVTTTYTVSITDSDGNMDTDQVVITVRPRTSPNNLDIIFNPNKVAFSNEDDPVTLSFTVSGGSTGTGTFSGPAVNPSLKKFYPSSAPLGNNDIALKFVNQDNCETSIAETVSVYDPNAFLNFLQPYYCPEGTENLSVVVPAGYTFTDIELYNQVFSAVPTGAQWTKNIGTRAVSLDLQQLPQGRYYFYIYYSYTYIVGYNYIPYFDFSCLCIQYNIVPITQTVFPVYFASFQINTPPTVNITSRTSSTSFCRNDPQVELNGTPIGGVWQGPGVTADVVNDGNPTFSPGDNGRAYFNPATANIGTNNLRYIFEDTSGCRDTAFVSFTVYNIPTVDFTAINGCVGIPVDFDITYNANGTTIDSWAWDFGDGGGAKKAGLPLDPTTYTYSSNNTYDVTFGLSTSDGCYKDITKTIEIGSIPDVDFSWVNVCDDQRAVFTLASNFVTTTPAKVQRITWNFGDGNSVERQAPGLNTALNETFGGATAIGTIFQPRYDYDAFGGFNVNVEVESDLGCTNDFSSYVYKVPTVGPVDNLNPYDEDFASQTIPWVSGGTSSSWQWGSPAATLIDDDANGGGSAWVTNLTGPYNTNEDSWVHSPCLDLSAIQRPVFAMDIRTLTLGNIDGAVLQMNYKNTTNTDADWITIGTTSTGKNWYDQSGIASNPGNQALNQYGWSGENDNVLWKRAIIALDNEISSIPAIERGHVRFRVAFSSAVYAPAQEGFAFDNVQIAQRDRIVLVEQFVNNGGSNTVNEPNKVSNQILNNFIDSSLDEAVKLEYHTGLVGPNDDPIYKDNTIDANARAAYYGVTSSPFTFVDSQQGNLSNIFSSQKLRPAEVSIDTIITADTPAETLNVEVTFTAKNDLPANTVLQIAVIEKSITAPEAMGTNGESEFRYVMKKLLPNALGTRFTDPILAGEIKTVNVSWIPDVYDTAQLAIVAFVQNEDTKEIYQTRILETPTYIPANNLVTGAEPSLAEQIIVYPNPANNVVYVQLPASAPERMPVRLIDNLGREHHSGYIEIGERGKSISTEQLSDGVHFVEIGNGDGSVIRRKVIVLRQH